jgi:hypothetical protein
MCNWQVLETRKFFLFMINKIENKNNNFLSYSNIPVLKMPKFNIPSAKGPESQICRFQKLQECPTPNVPVFL